MKNRTLLLVATLWVGQVVANSNSLTLPKANEQYLVHQKELDPSNFISTVGGQNLTWIIEKGPTSKTVMVNVISATQFTFTGSLKSADLVIENEVVATNDLTFGHTHYFIYKIHDNALIKLGRIDTDTITKESYSVFFSNPELKTDGLVYYHQAIQDSWSASYTKPSTNEQVNWVNGQSEYFVDATGELNINGYTFSNIYRIKRTKEYKEINALQTVHHQIESYEWWSKDVAFPIVSMELHTASDSTNFYTISYLDESHYVFLGVEDLDAEPKAATVYPNPSSGQVTVSYESSVSGFFQLTLYDLTGKEVKVLENKELSVGKHSDQFELDVKAGAYFLKTNVNGKIETTKLIVT